MKRLRLLDEVEDYNLEQWRDQGRVRFNEEKDRWEHLVVIPLSLWVHWEGETTLAEIQAKAGARLEKQLGMPVDWTADEMAEAVAGRRDE